jgi:hypothetical protein
MKYTLYHNLPSYMTNGTHNIKIQSSGDKTMNNPTLQELCELQDETIKQMKEMIALQKVKISNLEYELLQAQNQADKNWVSYQVEKGK